MSRQRKGYGRLISSLANNCSSTMLGKQHVGTCAMTMPIPASPAAALASIDQAEKPAEDWLISSHAAQISPSRISPATTLMTAALGTTMPGTRSHKPSWLRFAR